MTYDPYAGGGDLLAHSLMFWDLKKQKGLDIDSTLKWEINDSLVKIPQY